MQDTSAVAPADDLQSLRHQFNELTQQARRLAGDPRLLHSELAPLNARLREAIAVSKLIYAELARAEAPPSPVLPAATILRLLDRCREPLERIDHELSLLERLAGCGAELHVLTRELFHSRRCSPAPFRKLTLGLIRDVRACPSPRDLLPRSGVSVHRWLDQSGRHPQVAVLADSLLAARLMAWATNRDSRWRGRAEVLTLAALLQDVGMLSPVESQAAGARPAVDRHPQLGAALAAGIDRSSVDLPRLIAQHHERLDGTGMPGGLAARQLSEETRLMSAVTHFVELLSRSPAHRKPSPPQADLSQAAAGLCSAALEGEFDPGVVARFLDTLGLSVSADIRARAAMDSSAPWAELGGRTHRRDEAHIPAIDAHAAARVESNIPQSLDIPVGQD